MASENDHRIGRIALHLAAADPAALGGAARRFKADFDQQLLPVFQAAFDHIAPADRVLRLDRLTLDLGALDPTAPDFKAGLTRALDLAIAQVRPATQTPFRPAPRAQGQGNTPHASAAGELDPVQDFIAFLTTGTLSLPRPAQALDALIADLSARGEAAQRDLLLQLLPHLARPAIAHRFLTQLPLGLLARLVFAQAHWPAAALLAIPPGNYLPPAKAEALRPLVARLAETAGSPEAALTLAAALLAPPVNTASPPSPPLSLPGPEPGTAPLPVAHAGAVLLHPFLPAYLASLKVSHDGRLPDLASRERAVLLTHYLASGEESAAEPDCLLPKLLCGHPLHAPLPRATEIGPAVRAEAEALLAAAIRHWNRLGKASPEGLRQGFLSRPGMLRPTSEGWRLEVEQSAIDVLLDHLPWSITQVRTPFMDQSLAVAWR